MTKKTILLLLTTCIAFGGIQAQKINYVDAFANKNHPEIGYWFISPALIKDEKGTVAKMDSIATQCKYTLIFLTSREEADFYDIKACHDVFQKIVATAHKHGIKVGLQLWGNYQDKTVDASQQMIVENEVPLDGDGSASLTVKAKYIRFPSRLLRTDLFKVYAFKKTGEGFYDPATLIDITEKSVGVPRDKSTVDVHINAGAIAKGLTACVMAGEYCSQSSMWGDVEINGFTKAMQAYKDVHFDGFALDEYGNKFVERPFDSTATGSFHGRWFSTDMAAAYKKETGKSLDRLLFDGRYTPQGKPEQKIAAINEYMWFMRKGPNRVEKAVYKNSRQIFGPQIFSGIHNTYHNGLLSDEIWANGIGWWIAPRAYGQTDEKTPLPTQMGIAMAHPMNAMYNQYYDAELEPVLVKAFADLRYGVRTHYHALNDKRPKRFDLQNKDAVIGINKIENCARLLNNFNPSLPDIKLLVVFGMEALSNWYPNVAERGYFDINDKLKIEERAVDIWNSGYMNALVPSDLIVNKTITLNANGKPQMNGHVFDAILYLNPQYAQEAELKFLETYISKGGKLMIEGNADRDFTGKLITDRFNSIYDRATVKGYSIDNLSKLGLQKNLLPDGCRNEDGSYTFNNRPSLIGNSIAKFTVSFDGDVYEGSYKGIAVIKAGKVQGLQKLAAAGCTTLIKNGKPILTFSEPTDVFIEKKDGKINMTIADGKKAIKPILSKL
ncbi:MAG: hypothetical protein QM726_14615 [Chitinophagaceae bacterium]